MNPLSGYIKLAGGVLIALVLAAIVWKTYDFGFDNAQAIGDRNLSDYKAQLNGAAASSVSAAFADYASGVARGQAAETRFFSDQHQAAVQAADFKEQIDAVAQPHIAPSIAAATHAASGQSAALQPVRECVFSRGFVRLWNAAAGVSGTSDAAVQTGSDSGGTAGTAAADEAADSGVSQRDILDWLVDYANVKRGDEDKLTQIATLQQPGNVPASAPVEASAVATRSNRGDGWT